MARSQDLVFTLYGDYLRHRGGEAWTGSLIELLGPLGLSEQAVRSTLSRMSRKGWLKGRRVGNKSYYSLTPRSIDLLEEGAQRIFQPRSDVWDGRWYILVYSIPEKERPLRHGLRKRLTWLGFGSLSNATWVSPRDRREEVEGVVNSLGIWGHVEIFTAAHLGFTFPRLQEEGSRGRRSRTQRMLCAPFHVGPRIPLLSLCGSQSTHGTVA